MVKIEFGPYLCYTGGLVLFCVFESMQGNAGPLDVVTLPVEQCPDPEPVPLFLIPISLYML